MPQHPVNIGTVANDGTGDTLRVAFDKINDDLAALFTVVESGGGEEASSILTKLLTVDGAGSGLDADLLDGLQATAFALAAHTHAQSDVTGLSAALALKLDASAYTAADVLTKIKTVDGIGSGLDADLLDGLSSAAFATAVHSHAIADTTGLQAALDAKLPTASFTAAAVLSLLVTVDGSGSLLDADLLDGQHAAAFSLVSHTHAIADVTGLQDALDDLQDGIDLKLDASAYTAADVLAKLVTVDGAGSGLDADLLDGMSSAAFAASAHTHAQSDVTGLTAALALKLDASSYTANDVLAKLLTVDGAASGLDADLLDGLSSAAFFQTASVLLGVDGDATNPTYSFATDTNLGFFRQTDNVIGITVNGTQLGRIDNNGIWYMSALPAFFLVETDRPTDEQVWRWSANAGSIQLRAMNDARTLAADAFNISRGTGSTPSITAVSFGNSTDNPTASFLGTGNKIFKGVALGINGVVGGPTWSYENDPDTGLYRIASNQQGLTCAGTLVIDLSTSTVAITTTTVRFNTTTATTIGAAGGAAALPATPLGYLTVNVGGTAAKIPYYNT